MEQFKRSELLLGKENMFILENAHILIVGVGGVGGYVAEMLARSGVGNITLVDDDKVAKSNLNRQIIALHSTLGKNKVEVMKQRILDINPTCNVNIFSARFNKENAEQILDNKYDFVVDAIDSLQDKVLLVVESKKRKFNIISALGAGNKINIPQFNICDIYKTYNDGLARKFRKLLRDEEVDNLDVAFSNEKALCTENKEIGSVVYSPAMCGCVISAFVINKLIKNIC